MFRWIISRRQQGKRTNIVEDRELVEAFLQDIVIHEVGHIVVDMHYCIWPEYVTLEPNGQYLARVHVVRFPYEQLGELVEALPQGAAERYLLCQAHAALSGAVASAILHDRDYDRMEAEDEMGVTDPSSGTDYEHLRICIELLLKDNGGDVCSERYSIELEKLWYETEEIVRSHWQAVGVLADALVERRFLTKEDILRIWDELEGE